MTQESKNAPVSASAEVSIVPSSSLLEASKALDKLKPQFSIVPSYAEIKKPTRFIFCGIAESVYQIPDKETGEVLTKKDKVVHLLADGKMYVNKGVQLVRTFEENKVVAGQPVEISVKEEVKNQSGGKTKIYDVIILS